MNPRLLIPLLSMLVTALASANDATSEGERRVQQAKQQALLLMRDASNPLRPLRSDDAVIPDVEDLALRFKATKAKMRPDFLKAYQPGPAHAVLATQQCEVIEATPMGTPLPEGSLHMEYLAFRCLDGAKGTLTVARSAPPEVQVRLDGELITDQVANTPAIIRYYHSESGRLMITQSWMAGERYQLSLSYALPLAGRDLQRGMVWSRGRFIAEALHKAYLTP